VGVATLYRASAGHSKTQESETARESNDSRLGTILHGALDCTPPGMENVLIKFVAIKFFRLSCSV
jgi:hypothetical protein